MVRKWPNKIDFHMKAEGLNKIWSLKLMKRKNNRKTSESKYQHIFLEYLEKNLWIIILNSLSLGTGSYKIKGGWLSNFNRAWNSIISVAKNLMVKPIYFKKVSNSSNKLIEK